MVMTPEQALELAGLTPDRKVAQIAAQAAQKE